MTKRLPGIDALLSKPSWVHKEGATRCLPIAQAWGHNFSGLQGFLGVSSDGPEPDVGVQWTGESQLLWVPWNNELEWFFPAAFITLTKRHSGASSKVLTIIIPVTECPDEKAFATDRRSISKWNCATNRLAVHRRLLGGRRGRLPKPRQGLRPMF
jgi:hypothetical protein